MLRAWAVVDVGQGSIDPNEPLWRCWTRGGAERMRDRLNSDVAFENADRKRRGLRASPSARALYAVAHLT